MKRSHHLSLLVACWTTSVLVAHGQPLSGGVQAPSNKRLVGATAQANGNPLSSLHAQQGVQDQSASVPESAVAAALTGQVAGVKLTACEGSPGADVYVRLCCRGSITQDKPPLYVVDGIPMKDALSVISPQDIVSIEVVKQVAATTDYDIREANGVVLITTRSATWQQGHTSSQTDAAFGPRHALQLYPNPAASQCLLVHPAATREAIISVYSSLGQRVATVVCAPSSQQTALDLRSLAGGQYLVRYVDAEGTLTVKLYHQ